MKTREPGGEPMYYGWMDMSVPSKKLLETMSRKDGIQEIGRKKNIKQAQAPAICNRLDKNVSSIEETKGNDVKKSGIQARVRHFESLVKVRIDLSA